MGGLDPELRVLGHLQHAGVDEPAELLSLQVGQREHAAGDGDGAPDETILEENNNMINYL